MATPRSKPARSRLTTTAEKAAGVLSRLLRRIAVAGEIGLDGPLDSVAMAALERLDLVIRRPDGRFAVTALGRARLAREAGGETGFLAQHAELGRVAVEFGEASVEVLVDLDESPLAWLARRKGRDGRPLLAAHEVLAGERLRADFTRAQMTPRVTSNWSAAVASGRRGGAGIGVDVADSVVAARAYVSKAIEAVGPELSGALLDVCCFLKGLEEIEQARGWPARGGKLVLGLALARLARHYGYAEAAGPDRAGAIVSWGAPGSRPSIDGGGAL